MRLLQIAVAALLMSSVHAVSGSLEDQHDKGLAECRQKLVSGEFRLRMQYAACLNEVNGAYWVETSSQHYDLVEYAMSRELVAAQRFDRGQMTEAEYMAARAQIKSDLLTSVRQRDSAAAMMRPSPPISCFSSGNMTTCY